MRKYTWTMGQWKWVFNENVKRAPKSLPITLETFGQTFEAEYNGLVHKYKIYAVKPSARKWQFWARGLGGSEYKFTKDILRYIGTDKVVPPEYCGGQEFVPIHNFL